MPPSQLIDACAALNARREEIEGRMHTMRLELQVAITEARGLDALIAQIRDLSTTEDE